MMVVPIVLLGLLLPLESRGVDQPLHAIRALASVDVARTQTIDIFSCLGKGPKPWLGIARVPIGRSSPFVLILHALSVAAELATSLVNSCPTARGDDLDVISHSASTSLRSI